MVDNFELIKSLLTFDSEDDFYHLQIIRRMTLELKEITAIEAIFTYRTLTGPVRYGGPNPMVEKEVRFKLSDLQKLSNYLNSK